jgi:hypothetical protein
MFDAGVFGVAHFGADRFHGFGHALGLCDGNDIVVGAVKYPDGHFADARGGFGVSLRPVGRGKFHQLGMRLQRCFRRMDAAADHDHGGKLARIFLREVPAPVTAHGNPGEVGALGIAVKLFRRGLQCGHGEIVHRGLRPPGIFAALRHYHDGVEVASIAANRGADTHVGLVHAVVAALAGAMQEQDDRPFFVWRPIFGDEDLIPVRCVLQRDGAIEEAGFVLFPEGGKGQGQRCAQQYQSDHKRRDYAFRQSPHGFPQTIILP